MKKRTADKFWFPWWPDKWIFGSVRIEFTPAERGIWVDMLSLASKDNGHIRANEETPYPLQQLSGMLIINESDLNSAIEKFIKTEKLSRTESGTLYVTKWDKYQFSDRHRRRVEDTMSEKMDTMAEKQTPIIYNSKEHKNKEEKKNIKSEFENEFETLWEDYHLDGKKNKAYAKTRFIALCKKGKLEDFKKGYEGYANYLKFKLLKENFEQKPKYFSTLCTDYEEYIKYYGHKIKADL